MRVIDTEERRARLGRRHRLAVPADDVVEAARAMSGLHSSDPVTVYLSARARVEGLDVEDMESALYQDKSLIRLLAMRRTLFVVPIEMAPLLHHSSTVALGGPERRRLIKMVEAEGLTADGERWIRDLADRAMEALTRRGEAVATELAEDVPELGQKIVFYKRDGSVLTTVGLNTRILFLLAAEGRVVRGRPRGSWVSGQYHWAPMDLWLGGPMAEMSRAEAQATVLTSWLRTFGPGTELDMKWWTGWPVTQVRAALDAIGAVEVGLDDGTGHVLLDDLEPSADVGPWVAMLPSLDPTTMGWKQRDWYLGPHAPLLFDSNGNAGQTVWVDGRVVGGWGQGPTGDVRWRLLEDVGTEANAAIELHAEALETWLAGRTVSARFPAPLNRELAG